MGIEDMKGSAKVFEGQISVASSFFFFFLALWIFPLREFRHGVCVCR